MRKIAFVIPLAAFCAALVTSLPEAGAQEAMIQDWKLRATKVTGQTCEESEENKEIKCASLSGKDGSNVETTVAELVFRTRASRDVKIDFCAKIEDPMLNTVKCQALIDGQVAQPGGVKLTSSQTDYVSCMSWFGETEDGRGFDISVVEIQCKAQAGEDGETLVDAYTASVTSR